MTVTEVLQWADSLIFAKTNKHLDDLQETVIKGVWEKQTYEQIAEKSNRSESHIRDVGYKLLQVLSEQLGEDINKSNFSATFKRLNIKLFPSCQNNQNICQKGHNNFYNPQILFNSKEDNQENSNNSQLELIYHDLKLAPQIIKFYGRESELKQLENCVLNQNIKLISVLGLRGIGKSYLVRKFVDLNLEKFNVIIWKNLKLTNSFNEIITDMLTNINADLKLNENKLPQFLEFLKTKKCLIIFDDFQELFISGKLAGQFKPEYQDYQNLLKIIIEIEHQSNLILISQEQCQEMLCLDEELYPVKCLELEGLYNNEFLQKSGLKDQENWSNLINLYEGNPIYLKDIGNIIKDIYDGKVVNLLAENNSLFLTENMQSNFSQLFNKLSSIEQKIVLELSKFEQPVTKENLKSNLELSSMDLINGLQSLQRRYLITKIKRDKRLLNLSSVFSEYLRNCYKN